MLRMHIFPMSVAWKTIKARPVGRTALAALLLLLIALHAAGNDLPLEEATSFSVHEHDRHTLVEVTRPWPGADSTLRYALVDRTDAEQDGIPDGVPEDATIIETPVQRVVTTSTTFVAGFDTLDALDAIVGHDNPGFLYSEAARERHREGDISSVGNGSGLDLETVVDLDPDLVMLNQYDESDQTPSRLADADIPVLISGDWTEQSPLGRMEWLYLTGLLTGRADAASEYIRETAERYRTLAERVEDESDRPTVLINGPFEGSWAVPRADAYSARFIEDAGGEYAWEDVEGTDSLFLDTESVFDTAGDADIWINPGQWQSLDDIEDERLFEFAAVTEERVYNNNRRVSPGGGIDYFESGQVRPDVILADLVSIFHPELMPEHERVYYQRLE
ncbi:MAG: ABC transporter substrate-binding protein [Spirochaetia bacterium]